MSLVLYAFIAMIRLDTSFFVLFCSITIYTQSIIAKPLSIGSLSKRVTVSDVENDIQQISSESREWEYDVGQFGPHEGDTQQVTYVHNDAINLAATLTQIIPVVEEFDGPFSDTDAQTILSSLNSTVVQPQATVMSLMVSNKQMMSYFSPVGDFATWMLTELTYVQGNMSAYLDAIVAQLPDDMVDQGTTLQAQAMNNIDTAVAAY